MQEFWLLYRGMYRWFLIAVAVLVGWMMALEGIVFLAASGSLKRTPWIFLVLLVLVAFRLMPLVFAVLFGVFGTYWYYLHARRQVERTTTGGVPDLQAIARAGGTNWWAPLVAFGVLLGVLTITGCALAA